MDGRRQRRLTKKTKNTNDMEKEGGEETEAMEKGKTEMNKRLLETEEEPDEEDQAQRKGRILKRLHQQASRNKDGG